MADARWIDEQRLEVGGALFLVTAVPLGAAPDEFVIIKTPDVVRRYLALLSREKPSRIVELGVKEAGSTALIAMAAEPDVLLAVDLAAEIPSLLARLVESENLQHRLITAFGLDQADRAGLTRFIDSHLPDERIDLVVDDASHVLGPTRTSFEVLFPRLRPGGLYSRPCSRYRRVGRRVTSVSLPFALPAAMNRITVESRTVASASYDDPSSTMELEFVEGRVYRYFVVPRSVFDALLTADSIGRFFHEHIRDVYPFERIR